MLRKHRFVSHRKLTDVNSGSTISPDKAASPASLLQEASLRELLAAGVVTTLLARGTSAGFLIEIGIGERMTVLANARGQPRLFASMETIATLLQRLGHPRFEVDATHFVPGRVRAARPDRSVAMKAGKLPRADKPKVSVKATKAAKKSSQ